MLLFGCWLVGWMMLLSCVFNHGCFVVGVFCSCCVFVVVALLFFLVMCRVFPVFNCCFE